MLIDRSVSLEQVSDQSTVNKEWKESGRNKNAGERIIYLQKSSPFWSSKEYSSLKSFGLKQRTIPIIEYPDYLPADPEDEAGDPVIHGNGTSCTVISSWQSTSYPTSNILHEIDIPNGVRIDAMLKYPDRYQTEASTSDMTEVRILAHGGMRFAWLVTPPNLSIPDPPNAFVLKTLKWNKPYSQRRTYEKNRIDAMASERLTFSPHVIDVFGYAGQSVLNELASGYDLKIIHRSAGVSNRTKLRFAADVAEAIADLQRIDGEGNATLVHNDMGPSNFLVVRDTMKLSDFNLGHILLRDDNTGNLCPLEKSKRCGAGPTNRGFRSPEDCGNKIMSEKIDTYGLGAILFYILTRKEPYHIERPKLKDAQIVHNIAHGIPPLLPNKYKTLDQNMEQDAMLIPIRDAMILLMEPDPDKRVTARVVADSLQKAVDDLLN